MNTPNRNGRVYSEQVISQMSGYIKKHQILFDLKIVPKELTSKVEVELDDGFVLSKVENVIQTNHRFGNNYILKKIEEQRPDIMCAVDSTYVDNTKLEKMVYDKLYPYTPDIHPDNICYSCESCQD